MNTLQILTENFLNHADRNPLSADPESILELSKMQAHSVTSIGALISEAVDFENGKSLHWHAFRTGPTLFLRLSTVKEYAETFNETLNN